MGNTSQQRGLAAKKVSGIWAALGKASPAGPERCSLPSALRWWGLTWSSVPRSGSPSKRETWTYWEEPSGGPPRCSGDRSTSPVMRGWESWDVQPGEEGARGDLIHAYRHLQGGCEGDGARLCLVVPSAWTRSSGHKWTQEVVRKHCRCHSPGTGCPRGWGLLWESSSSPLDVGLGWHQGDPEVPASLSQSVI